MDSKLTTHICYIIIINSSSKKSFFNGYDDFLIDNVNAFELIGSLPKDVPELFRTPDAAIRARISGRFNGYMVRFASSLEEAKKTDFNFNVVFSSSDSDESRISQVCFISALERDTVHHEFSPMEKLNLSSLRANILKLSQKLPTKELEDFNELMGREVEGVQASEYLEFERSIYNRSSLGVLRSLGVEYSFEDVGMHYDESVVVDPANILINLRNISFRDLPLELRLPHIQLVLSDMSSDLDSLVNKSFYSENYLKNEGYDEPRLMAQALALINRNEAEKGMASNPIVKRFYQERVLIESMIALYAASYAVSCVKVPLGNSAVFGKLKDIGVIDRGNSGGKMAKAFAALVNELNAIVPPRLAMLPDVYASKVKIVSNLPLEWSTVNGLPMMVRHEVSRIPVSPGISTAQSLLDGEQIYMTLEDLTRVRVISSFSDSDPIKDHLRSSVELVLDELPADDNAFHEFQRILGVSIGDDEEAPNINIEWHNVKNGDELLASLTDNDCAVTIFDLHGAHSVQGSGILAVGGEKVSIYDLIGKFRASPIVVMSSCDTSPIDRNHYSTASAFLLAGAKTVLASALPIMSREASIFIARLLLRIQRYLPKRLMEGSGDSLRWSRFISGMIRRSYYTELFRLLKDKLKLNEELVSQLNFYAGTHLDPLHENWHKEIMRYTSIKTGVSLDIIDQLINSSFALPECLKYIQMGNPESIVLVADKDLLAEKNKGATESQS